MLWKGLGFPLALMLCLELAASEPISASFDALGLIKKHCTRCHGAEAQEGGIRLDQLAADPSKQPKLWQEIRDQIAQGSMPPAEEPRVPVAEQKRLLAFLDESFQRAAPRLPNDGNLIPHELLFGKPVQVQASSAPRLWRLSPESYQGFVRDVHRGKSDGVINPFTLTPERGIRDFAALYSVDEPSTEILLRNAELIVTAQTAHQIKDGKFSGKNDTVPELLKLVNPAQEPTVEQLDAAIRAQFRLATGRAPEAEEVTRYRELYQRCLVPGAHPAAAKTMLQAILLRADAMYRVEYAGVAQSGRQRLTDAEVARAVGLAINDRRDQQLQNAAAKSELQTKEQIAAHVRRLLSDPKSSQTAIWRFFREYFEYHKAVDVFKDKPKSFVHEPRTLVSDTDRLVKHIVTTDHDVFRQLLTTRLSFVNYATKDNKQTRQPETVPAVTLNPVNNKGQTGVESVYGIEEFPKQQPAELPAEQRLGILMQPSWLAAFSTNFDNDPVRRGRWIRERLLGGTVPDLPIGVAAQVPDAPEQTFRARLQVTREARCWKCHQQMDELGLPFENFDHYGRFRTAEEVRDLEATAANVDKKSKQLGPVMKPVALDTTGNIARSGDETLDGAIRDPRELVLKLANSTRTRQVFVRHAFRYFLGRNETLTDAATLQATDRAYLESDGSFRALVVSLLTSDSFLYRDLPNTTSATVP